MIKVTSLQAAKPLTKVFKTPTDVTAYPLVSKCTSTEHDVDPLKIDTMADVIRSVAKGKGCLLKGPLNRQLTSESRAGHCNKNAPSRWIMIDVDGLELGFTLPNKVGTKELKSAADMVIDELPEAFQGVSYIAQASSSFGLKGNKVSLHLFFMLSSPMVPVDMKELIKQINFESELFSDNIRLSGNQHALSWPIDPSVADNSKLIFVCDPVFKNKKDDPFKVTKERLYVHHDERVLVDLSDLKLMSTKQIRLKSNAKLKDLRSQSNLPATTANIKNVAYGGDIITYIKNPDPCTIDIIDDSNLPYVRCNINGGDSGGYYFLITNPKYMRNFKGEPFFEIAQVNPTFASSVSDIYGDKMEAFRTGRRPIAFRDHASNLYYNGVYDSDEDEWVENFALAETSLSAIPSFIADHDGEPLEFVPQGNLVFDPHDKELRVQLDKSPYYVNAFSPTQYMYEKQQGNIELDKWDMSNWDGLQKECPLIFALILHICGTEMEDARHFVNWLAFCFNTRRKSGVAWIFNGTQGTGKGVFFTRVIQNLYGKEYARLEDLQTFEDDFNGSLERLLMIGVDEYRDNDTRGNGSRIVNKMKRLVTDETQNIRKMRSNRVQVKSYSNLMFFTNDIDAVKIPAGDRRYTVATPQHVMLRDNPVFKTKMFQLDMGIVEAEVPRFAKYLLSYNYDSTAARTARESAAKTKMRNANMFLRDEFVDAVNEGNLEWFAQVLEVDPNNLVNGGVVIAAHKAVIRLAKDVRAGHRALAQTSELMSIYNALCEDNKKQTPRAFSKLMDRTRATKKQYKWPDGSKRPSYLLDEMDDQLIAQGILDDYEPQNDIA